MLHLALLILKPISTLSAVPSAPRKLSVRTTTSIEMQQFASSSDNNFHVYVDSQLFSSSDSTVTRRRGSKVSDISSTSTDNSEESIRDYVVFDLKAKSDLCWRQFWD